VINAIILLKNGYTTGEECREMSPWPDKLQMKLYWMKTDAGYALSSCFIERMFMSGTDFRI
jgi:hypothetical protein